MLGASVQALGLWVGVTSRHVTPSSGPGTPTAAGVWFFSSQETCSRGRTVNQYSCPCSQEKAQPRFWGFQLMVAAGLLLWTLVGTQGWVLCLHKPTLWAATLIKFLPVAWVPIPGPRSHGLLILHPGQNGLALFPGLGPASAHVLDSQALGVALRRAWGAGL